MTEPLLLLLQGGLGNQLLQLVLGESLAQVLGRRLMGSTVLMESRSRRFRRVTHRDVSPLVRQRLPLGPVPWHRHLAPRLAARLGDPLGMGLLTDRVLVEAARGSSVLAGLDGVRVIHSHATHPGVFGAEFTSSWQATLEALGPYGRGDPPEVAVHVRRSDYLNPRSGFVLLGEPYYRAALGRALALVATGDAGPMAIHVFSDDPAWCRSHLQDRRWRLRISEGTPEEDLAAMAAARVLITGNSSLSAIAGHLAQLREPRTPVLTPGQWLLREDGRLGNLRKADWQVVVP